MQWTSIDQISLELKWSFCRLRSPKPKIYSLKESPAQTFSLEFCEIFENNFFIEHLPGDCFYQIHVVNTRSNQRSKDLINRFNPISCHWFLSIPPENIRKP